MRGAVDFFDVEKPIYVLFLRCQHVSNLNKIPMLVCICKKIHQQGLHRRSPSAINKEQRQRTKNQEQSTNEPQTPQPRSNEDTPQGTQSVSDNTLGEMEMEVMRHADEDDEHHDPNHTCTIG